jgi:HlyD family secretion protein
MESPDSHSPVRLRSIRDTSATDLPIDQSPRMRRHRRLIIVGSLIAIVVFSVATFAVRSWISTSLVIPRERVRIATVVRGSFIRDVAAQGTVITANSPTLFAPATGTVTFDVRAGDRVTKGQVLGTVGSPNLVNEHALELATLDGLNVALGRQDIEMRMQILKNREDSDQAGVQIHAAEREMKRAETSWAEHLIPERDYAKARDDVASAKLSYDHAIANEKLENERLQFDLRAKRLERDRQKLLVDNLARRVGDLTLRSPVDGKIGSLAVDQKATVAENAALLTVVDLSALEIEFRVPESYAAQLGVDMGAEVTYGDQTYKALVTSISPEVVQNEVKGRLRFAGTPPPDLRQNQRVNVRIVMDARDNVLMVERGAFIDAGGVTYVIAGDEAKRRQIKLGPMGVGEVEIVSGLVPGERIVISGLGDFNDAPVVRLSD